MCVSSREVVKDLQSFLLHDFGADLKVLPCFKRNNKSFWRKMMVKMKFSVAKFFSPLALNIEQI